MTATQIAELLGIADALDNSERNGKAVDSPDGSRYICISDTLANQFSATIRRIAGKSDTRYLDEPIKTDICQKHGGPILSCPNREESEAE